MRIADPNGTYKRHPQEPRLMVPREPGEFGGEYFRLMPEGTLKAYDGLAITVNRDPEGLDLNRNFPPQWRQEHEQVGAGPYPTSEPEVRAVVDFIVRHPNIGAAISYHTHSGVILRPMGTASDDDMIPEDLWAYKRFSAIGEKASGYPAVSIFHDFRYHPKEVISGTQDWVYEHLGALFWVVEIWAPNKEAGITDYQWIEWYREHPVEDDLKLLKWSDEQCGGRAHVDWYPFQHPQLGAVELGGWDKLMETLKERLAEQKGRHQGGNKWIGTGGTSPFGADGYNPEGVRIGQKTNRNFRAVKVWDKREFKDLDDTVELGTRNIKVALRRLRRFAREGAAEELDLDDTIRSTARQGWLDVKLVPERRNTIKVLLFFDVGGSMDPHVRVVEELFSAARAEFKHLEYYYFHNCLYEGVWRDNRRRWDQTIPTWDLLHRYGRDWKVIVVGDASMSPYEIVAPGGANEHWNPEAGQVWLDRARAQWPSHVWLNPIPERMWGYTQSIGIIREIFEGRMFPLTLDGIGRAIKALG